MERTTFRRASATLIAAALLFAACGDDDTTADAGGSTDTTMAVDQGDEEPIESTTTITVEGDEDTPPTEGTVIDVSASGGTVDGGGRMSVSLGDTVTIRVTSDVDDHIHLHGYDVMVDISAGETADLTFDATIPGVFEVELEESRIQLVELEIS